MRGRRGRSWSCAFWEPSFRQTFLDVSGDMRKMRIRGIPYRSCKVADVFGVLGNLHVRQRVASKIPTLYLPRPKSADHHSTCCEREREYMLKDAPVFAMLRVFKGCLRRSSPVRKCTTSSTDSRNDLHKRHQTRLRKVAFCATLSANVSNISIHLAPNMRACSPCRGIALHLI